MSLHPAHPLPPYPDFATASRAVVAFLNARIPLAVWSVNRAEGASMIVLHPSDANGYQLKPGDSMVYAETLCSRMVAGRAPSIAPVVDAADGYRDAPIRQLVPINTYVSFPLQRADGALFGTLCGFDPQSQDPALLEQQPMIELLSRQLSTILQFDLERETAWRLAVQHEASAMTDALTGIGNRRAFDLFCAREEDRCRDVGQRLSVIAFDLDGLKPVNDQRGHAAGDALIQRAAHTLREHLRPDAHLARTGGDEFVVLLPGCALAEAGSIAERLRDALAQAGVASSLGCAERKPHRGLTDALSRADAAMYADKTARKAARR
ncbi:MAG: sensor domain-containing diguanylate cyclase [Xanthomonadales bacterium]|nr:sensor domain-containing diguanylate cyclase [Xanthomonadales bacterium]